MARSSKRFRGKVVLITGASGGQGRVQARMFASEGATVVLTDVTEAAGKAAAAQISAKGGKALFLKHDVTALSGWQQVIRRVQRELGELHVLVNNAGVVSRTSIRTLSMAEWQRVIAINLTGPMLGIQAAAPLMRDSGGGSVINISSTAGLLGHPGVAYAASKWGLRGVTKSAAMELLDWNIRVNSVHPGIIETPMMEEAMAAISQTGGGGANAVKERFASFHPMGRLGRDTDIANAVVFLASDKSAFMTGAELVVDGGMTAM